MNASYFGGKNVVDVIICNCKFITKCLTGENKKVLER